MLGLRFIPLVCLACAAVVAARISLGETTREQGVRALPTREWWQQIFENVHINVRSVVCFILTFSVSALANAAGVGGGGFLVPLFNLVLGQGLKAAMALSQAAILGGALAASIFALFSTHPLDATKPVLDLDIALVLLPSLLFGVTLGVTFNELFPNWLLVIVLSILLGIMAAKTLRSGLRLHAAERRSQEADEEEILLFAASSEVPNLTPKAKVSREFDASVSSHFDRRSFALSNSPSHPVGPELSHEAAEPPWRTELLTSHPVIMDSSEPSSLASSPRSVAHISEAMQGDKASSVLGSGDKADGHNVNPDAASQDPRWTEESNEIRFVFQTPFQEASQQLEGAAGRQSRFTMAWQLCQLLMLLVILAAFLALQLIKDRYKTCTSGFYALFGAQTIFCLVASTGFIAAWVKGSTRGKATLEAPLLNSPRPAHPRLSGVKLAGSAAVVLLGGCLASLCGLGGGLILGPVMLELGLHPMATAFTSLLLVGASSSLAALDFALEGRLDYGWAIIMLVTCSIASIIGVAGIGSYVRSSGRASIIVFLLVFTMAAGGILTAVFGGIHAVQTLKHGGRAGFVNLCKL